ncbi:MAG: hypothetical protein ACI9ES_002894 [Oceanospirillaceae bacterium]|jgi:hypothetical protein
MRDGKVIINDHLLWGVILSLIGDGVNSTEKMINSHQINCGRTEIELNEMWGELDEIDHVTGFGS